MTDEEAIEELKKCKECHYHNVEDCLCEVDYNFKETVLNLIKKQELEISALNQVHDYDVNMIDEVKGEAAKLYRELEKKDKRILDLEFALMDMVLQFADENKNKIRTMGLSALEIAFSELDFNNPMPIKEVHNRYKKLAQEYYK